MNKFELTIGEVLYLEALLRQMQGSGGPIGLKEGDNLAQSILDKLEKMYKGDVK